MIRVTKGLIPIGHSAYCTLNVVRYSNNFFCRWYLMLKLMNPVLQKRDISWWQNLSNTWMRKRRNLQRGESKTVITGIQMYKHQWNTMYYTLYSVGEVLAEQRVYSIRSLLLWSHNKLCQQKNIEMKWFAIISLALSNITLALLSRGNKISSLMLKCKILCISLVHCVHSWNIFQQRKGNCLSSNCHWNNVF